MNARVGGQRRADAKSLQSRASSTAQEAPWLCPRTRPQQGHVGSRRSTGDYSRLFRQRNPSAAGRALVLITPRPLAAGVTSATRALSSSFQTRGLSTPPLPQGGCCRPAAPPEGRRCSQNCACVNPERAGEGEDRKRPSLCGPRRGA